MTPRGSVPPPDAPACLLAVGMDMRITRWLEKYMPGYQIIPLKNSRHLKEAIREHQPRAVLYNESAAVFQENIPVPCIRCSIPDPMLAIQESGITRHLSKPLSSQKLLHEIPENARSVLVIDDDPGFVQLVERFIQQAQLSVEIYRAYSGQEGLTLLETKSPDLILVDMVMPEMNGLEVIREIRKRHTMPIILLTAMNYDFISESISEFSMVWSDKLYPSEIFLCMGAAIHTLKQRYFE